MHEDLKKIEAVLEEKVRPALHAHGGEIQIDHLAAGPVRRVPLGGPHQ